MSIIFKALKKAEEESRVERTPVKKAQAYQFGSKKSLVVLIGIAVLAVSSFAGIYLAKNKIFSRLFAKSSGKAVEVQPKPAVAPQPQPKTEQVRTTASVPPAPAAETVKKKEPQTPAAPDTAKIQEDAIRHIKDKKYSEAEDILRRAMFAKPGDAAMHNNLGIALKNQGRYKEAVAAYEKALKLKPGYYEAINNLAVVYEMLGDKKKAQSFYKKALSAKPSYAEAHLNYALLLEAEGNNSEAESHYQNFLSLSSDEALKNKVKERLKALKK